jgi:hypothetical protein
VSFVAAVTAALRSLKVKCDRVDVAGASGYAFVVNVHPDLGAIGPTAFDWEMLADGIRLLGIDVQLVTATRSPADDERLRSELFEKVREEIDAGRPCVVWGAAGETEFGLVAGYMGEGLVVRSPHGKDRDLGRAELNPVACFGLVTFGARHKPDPEHDDRQALTRAVQLLSDRHPCYLPGYHHGAAAFNAWACTLEQRASVVSAGGHAHNGECYSELQGLAAEYCQRLGHRHKAANAPLTEAAGAFGESAKRLAAISRQPSAAELRECGRLNAAALAALQRAIGLV